jgi:glutamine amidotransferase
MIGIISYGLGNVQAIRNLLNIAQVPNEIVNKPSDVTNKHRVLIIPGVGSFDSGMIKLEQSGFRTYLLDSLGDVKLVGICLGMQLLFDASEEGSLSGLGLLPGTITRLTIDDNLGVPNCGWRPLKVIENRSLLKIPSRVYLNHSYAFREQSQSFVSSVLAENQKIVTSVEKDNIFGFQFHPERSHKFGLQLFQSLGDLLL